MFARQTVVPRYLIHPEIPADMRVCAPIFFKRGNVRSLHSRIACSFRSFDLRSGFWFVNPKERTICHVHVCPNDFPVTCLITALMRSSVQRSVLYLNFLAPFTIACLSFFRSLSVICEGNPVCPLDFNPRIPCCFPM